MPEISRFFGIVIRMYWNDHAPPHFHAQYGKFKASFDIETSEKTKGKLPPAGERLIREWAKRYKKQLLENWETMGKIKLLNR